MLDSLCSAAMSRRRTSSPICPLCQRPIEWTPRSLLNTYLGSTVALIFQALSSKNRIFHSQVPCSATTGPSCEILTVQAAPFLESVMLPARPSTSLRFLASIRHQSCPNRCSANHRLITATSGVIFCSAVTAEKLIINNFDQLANDARGGS